MDTKEFLNKQLNYKQLYVLSHFLDSFLLKFYGFSFYREYEENIQYLIEHKNQTLCLNDILDTNHKEYYHILFAITSYIDSLSLEILNNLEK